MASYWRGSNIRKTHNVTGLRAAAAEGRAHGRAGIPASACPYKRADFQMSYADGHKLGYAEAADYAAFDTAPFEGTGGKSYR